METTITVWPLWRRWLFRFFFIWFALMLAPISWLNIDLAPVNYVSDGYWDLIDIIVNWGNEHLFHIKKELVPLNGSGDTSFAWAQECMFLFLALAGCIIWSVLDRKRKQYEVLDYWLRTFVRYGLILVSFSYGASKLFALQMPYPSQSMMATRLGDLLPMRLSWMFLGYGTSYQVFSGIMELLVGVLLLFRRTQTAGLLLGVGVYGNVMMLNLGYDIPVKLFAIHYVFYCLFLLSYQSRRLWSFFIQNRATAAETLYTVRFPKKWMKLTKIVFKAIFILICAIVPLIQCYEEYMMLKEEEIPQPFYGFYEISHFSVNGRQIPCAADAQRWNDIVFDKGMEGSIGATDTLFRQRYGRSYFFFETDSVKPEIVLQRMNEEGEPEAVCTLQYAFIDKNRILLNTRLRDDSVSMEMTKSKRSFQLSENQFHWLSESNR